jgi:predicted transcriptional regulator
MAMMTREASRPNAELKMAAAGPICSAIIGGICFLIRALLGPGMPPLVATMVLWLGVMNLALAVFNLIPGFPLDGGRIFRATIWRRSGDFRRSTRIATRVGRGVGYFFISGGIAVAALSLFGLAPFGLNAFSGVWLAFIGWFLKNAAENSYRQSEFREALRRFTAAQVMLSSYPVVPPDITLTRLVEERIFPAGHRLFMVGRDARAEGILPLDSIKSVSRRNWDSTLVRDIMTPLDKLRAVPSEESALRLLELMNESGINQVLVVGAGGRVIGLVTRERLTGFLRAHTELGI